MDVVAVRDQDKGYMTDTYTDTAWADYYYWRRHCYDGPADFRLVIVGL